MSAADVISTVGKALAKHADQLPTILRLGEAVLKVFRGDEQEALKAIRALELDRRKARDRRMGRR